MTNKKVMLVTGAAQRIGAHIAKSSHANGYNVVLHYRQSSNQTQDLSRKLNEIRPKSCFCIQADFNEEIDFDSFIQTVNQKFGRLDVLINNASDFFSTKLEQLSITDYDKLFNSNVRGPLFLAKSCLGLLKKTQGTIINIVDIHADKPLKDFSIYSMAKAANKMMVKALAKECAPLIRVNGISPGCIIWPSDNISSVEKKKILSRIALSKTGNEQNIFQTIMFLIENDYMTGQIIKVDGGRTLNM